MRASAFTRTMLSIAVPVTLQNSVSGRAFVELAQAVVKAVDERNASLPPTHRVVTH